MSHQTVRLSRGRHRSPSAGVCVMELASMLAGERFGEWAARQAIARGDEDGAFRLLDALLAAGGAARSEGVEAIAARPDREALAV